MDTIPPLPSNPVSPQIDIKPLVRVPYPEIPTYNTIPNVLLSILPLPFDEHIGNKVSPKITKMLLTLFPNTEILNIREFYRQYGRAPCISSSFMVYGGRSFTYQCEYQGSTLLISIHNGTLKSICNIYTHNTDLKEILNLPSSMTFNEYHYIYLTYMNQ
jgi:hypothetical protein